MAVRVLTAARTQALVGLAVVKDRLHITGTAQDAALTLLIAEASSAIVAWLARPLARQRYEQACRGNGRRRLLLDRHPVDRDSVTVEVDGEAVTDFVVVEPEGGMLSRGVGWPRPSAELDDENNVVVTYRAGYVLPEMISTWTASATAVLGEWLRPTSPALTPFLLEVTTGGALGGTEPTYPAAGGGTVASGAAVLTARDAAELPPILQQCAWVTVLEFYQRTLRLPGVTSMSADGFSASFDLKALDCALPSNVERSLAHWRQVRL